MSTFDPNQEQARLEQIDAEYSETHASPTEAEANAYAVDAALPYIEGETLVMGAAVGAWAEAVLAKLGHFSIVDAVAASVERVTQRYGENVRGHVSLFETFSPEQRFDCVVMGHILEHVLEPIPLLTRCKDWLTPRGRLLVIVPNADSIHRLIGVQMGMLESSDTLAPSDLRIGHRRVYRRETLDRDLEAAGWRAVHSGGLVLKPLANSQMDAWPDELRRAFISLGEQFPTNACMLFSVCERDA